jgi:predicted MPP superfamily phosphohydrolase
MCFYLIWLANSVHAQDMDSKTDPNDFTFIVAGHVYGAPNSKNDPFHPPFMKAMDSLKNSDSIDFMVLTGDIVQKSNTRSWDKVDNYLAGLDMRVIFAPGNHDLTDRELYTERYGRSNYSFEIGNNLFLILDLLESGWNIPEGRMNAIWNKCDEHRYENVFIFSHHIFWYDEEITPKIKPNSLYAKNDVLLFYTKTLPLLESIRSNVYIYGGDVGANAIGSELSLLKHERVHLIASGMGGEKWDNILKVSVKNEIVHTELIYLQNHKSEVVDTMFTKLKVDE